jgi:hypothetical protein
MLNQCDWGSKRLRTHSARVVPLVRRLGRSLGHVIRHHIESGTEGGGDVSEFDVLAKHVHAHVDMSSGGLVCWVKAHNNSPFVVHIDVGGTKIAKTKVLQEHGASAAVAVRVSAPVGIRKTVKTVTNLSLTVSVDSRQRVFVRLRTRIKSAYHQHKQPSDGRSVGCDPLKRRRSLLKRVSTHQRLCRMVWALGIGSLQINPDSQSAKESPVSGTKSLIVRCAQGCVS